MIFLLEKNMKIIKIMNQMHSKQYWNISRTKDMRIITAAWAHPVPPDTIVARKD